MTQRDDLENRDKFGDKLRDAEKAREDQFFAELDKKLVARLKEQEARRTAAGNLSCPACKEGLRAIDIEGVRGDQCPSCGGIWLAKSELDRAALDKGGKGLLARLFGRGD